MKNRSFIRLITITSLIAVISLSSFSIFFLSPSFTKLIIKETEFEAIKVGQHLSVSFSEIEKVGRELPDGFVYIASRAVNDFGLVKINVFAPDGEVVYSTLDEDIGKINKNAYFYDIVAKGQVIAKLVHKNTKSLNNQVMKVDVVETYVPIMHGADFAGAFEIYFDITDTINELNVLLFKSNFLLLLIAAGLMLIVLVTSHIARRSFIQQEIADKKIKQQLLEKEIILKEVHHRIKNNFASIGGLLFLQVQSISNPEAISALQDAIGRINSMQVLYEKLLLTDNYVVTSIKLYLDNLIDEIISIFPENPNVTVEKQIVDFQLEPKRLIPIGIIVNELLTNIMKYAFTGGDSDLIQITLKESQGNVTLVIQDNGNGLPEDFDLDTQKGFGLMLVKMLSEQLTGNFSIENNNGTKSTLEFSI